MDGIIKSITESNLYEVIHLYISVFNEEPWEDNWNLENAEKRWEDFLKTPGFVGFSYYINEEMVGLVAGHSEQWSEGKHFYLREMCVANQFQGKEIGTRLMQELDEHLINSNVTVSYLLTVNGGQAEAFYKKNGYVINRDMVLLTK